MATPIAFNEASCSRWPADPVEGIQCLASLSAALRGLYERRPEIVVLSSVPFGEMRLGEMLFSQYLGVASAREYVRTLLVFKNKAPISGYDGLDLGASECSLDGVVSVGALAAHALGSLVVSFPSCPFFSNDFLDGRIFVLSDGLGELVEDSFSLRNLAVPGHVVDCASFLSSFIQGSVSSGRELWENRFDWFPSIRFLNGVEGQLARLTESSGLAQVSKRLFELQDAVSGWSPSVSMFPSWKTLVSPESETRKSLCTFFDGSGVSRVYDLHARYTPGAGRIHFRLVQESCSIELAYIGPKL